MMSCILTRVILSTLLPGTYWIISRLMIGQPRLTFSWRPSRISSVRAGVPDFSLSYTMRYVRLDAQNSTLLDVYRMLTDEKHRARIVGQALDPVTRDFWYGEFAGWPERDRLQAVGSIRNKLGQIRRKSSGTKLLGQFTGKLDIDFIINNKRILVCNLSKGTLGPDQANLLGSLLVARFQAAAFSRAKIPEEERLDFNLTIDEFQNFMTDSFVQFYLRQESIDLI